MAALCLCRKLWLASVFALAITMVASAGDLPFKMPIVAPSPLFSWTGVYLGIRWRHWLGQQCVHLESGCHAGCGRGSDAKPGSAAAAWPDARIGPDQWRIFGGQIGGNWQVERAVFGIQADAHWADIEGHGSCFDAGAVATAGLSFACNDKVSSFGTITGRVGAAVDRALIYAKGGWAWEFGQHT